MHMCGNCRFWEQAEVIEEPVGIPDLSKKREEKVKEGICKRYPPVPQFVVIHSTLLHETIWPGTREDEECGEFSPRM